jgi:hypothetical protein
MPYCPRCGVEVEHRLEKCPLCDTSIPDEVRDRENRDNSYPMDLVNPKKMYKSLSSVQRRIIILSLMVLLGLLPILLTGVLDLLKNQAFTWSYYVVFSLIGALGIASLFIQFAQKPLVSVNGSFFLFVIIYMLLKRDSPAIFFQSADFFILMITILGGESLLVYLCVNQRKWYNIVSYTLFIISFFLTALDYILTGNPQWSFIVFSVLFFLAFYFFYIGRVKRRGLNVIGFFFFLISLMLLALDFSTGFVGWSLVTAVIFGLLSVIFYIMHFILFNDTDWRKALHL